MSTVPPRSDAQQEPSASEGDPRVPEPLHEPAKSRRLSTTAIVTALAAALIIALIVLL